MLQKRVIPCLLLYKGGLYKTERFKKPTYIGDPLNAIKIFNDKEVDELIFLDIMASTQNKEPNYQLIEDIASECFMPVCYGGGVKNIEQMRKIYGLGIEKISLSTAVVSQPSILMAASKMFGSQSVVVTIDVKKDIWGRQKVYIKNGKQNTKIDCIEFAKTVQDLGAGELVINSIDNDGLMKGYDLKLLSQIKEHVTIPTVALGGAGELNHIKEAFHLTNIDAVACGSLFVYQGALKGVLINYPTYDKIQAISQL